VGDDDQFIKCLTAAVGRIKKPAGKRTRPTGVIKLYKLAKSGTQCSKLFAVDNFTPDTRTSSLPGRGAGARAPDAA